MSNLSWTTWLGRYAPAGVMKEDDDGGAFDKDLKFACSINEVGKLDVLCSVTITHNTCFKRRMNFERFKV